MAHVRNTRYLCIPIMIKTATPNLSDLRALPLFDDQEARVFVMKVGDHRARMEYERTNDRMFLTNTNVPAALEGRHVANVLTEKVLTFIEDNKLKLVPMCPKVKAHLRSNPAWQRLMVKGLHL